MNVKHERPIHLGREANYRGALSRVGSADVKFPENDYKDACHCVHRELRGRTV